MIHNLRHPDVFKHYPNNYFVKTGSNLGVGIQEAVAIALWDINPDYTLRLIRGTYPHDVVLAKL